MGKFLKLENVEETAKQHPETFFLPPLEERKSQKIGASVRLHFILQRTGEKEPGAERMWVTVTREQGFLKSYKGIMENAPVFIEDLKCGDEITFDVCNIAQTIIKKGDPRWIDSANLKALVSKMCFEKDGVVRFLYRQKADREEDSGWRMFSGLETQEYTDDSKNIQPAVVGFMLDRDPSLLEPLKGDFGAVFERKEKNQPWNRVTDWSPGE